MANVGLALRAFVVIGVVVCVSLLSITCLWCAWRCLQPKANWAQKTNKTNERMFVPQQDEQMEDLPLSLSLSQLHSFSTCARVSFLNHHHCGCFCWRFASVSFISLPSPSLPPTTPNHLYRKEAPTPTCYGHFSPSLALHGTFPLGCQISRPFVVWQP